VNIPGCPPGWKVEAASHLTEENIEFIQENVDREWKRLVGRAGQ